MKQTFIKFLPLMAAVMLATSCSKDDENQDAVKPDTETVKQGVPFTLQVVTEQKLSKVGYDDNGTNVQPSFTTSDVNNL